MNKEFTWAIEKQEKATRQTSAENSKNGGYSEVTKAFISEI